jgi:hypothetical protein
VSENIDSPVLTPEHVELLVNKIKKNRTRKKSLEQYFCNTLFNNNNIIEFIQFYKEPLRKKYLKWYKQNKMMLKYMMDCHDIIFLNENNIEIGDDYLLRFITSRPDCGIMKISKGIPIK